MENGDNNSRVSLTLKKPSGNEKNFFVKDE